MPRKHPKLKCGCDFGMRFTRNSPADPNDHAVRVSKVHYLHGKGCIPSGEQYRGALTGGGHMSRLVIARVKNSKLHTIVQLLDSSHNPSTKTMRAPLIDIVPKGFDVPSQFINNLKAKVRAKITSGDFKQLLVNGTVSNDEANFVLSNDLPPQYLSIAEEVANESLKESLPDFGTMCLVVEYLCKLHQQDPSFLFDIQRSEENAIVGICWQTASMPFDWDSSASCISLDGMKRQLNKFSYPYLAVTSLDGYPHTLGDHS